jgi:hypothetical protein
MPISDDLPDVPVHPSTTARSGDENFQKDLLWGLYEDLRSHARHAETLRSNAGSYMLAVAGALIGVITFDQKLNGCDLPLAIIVTVLGLLTALFSASYAELYFRNIDRARRVLQRLDEAFFQTKAPITLSELAHDAENQPTTLNSCARILGISTGSTVPGEQQISPVREARFAWARHLTGSTHGLWIVLPAIVCVMGGYLIYRSVSGLTSACS